ncbi:hypothetical protein ACQEVB_37405 [Pseudonocardia sp. CA-107938]|uniref:hypothetical protein n=1 Tax=Pseudonocardia sp. CA-107938 TaxID=3240021 RepID=UPI003D927E52
MSLPGDRFSPEVDATGPAPPADTVDLLPIYCRHGVTWSWVDYEGGYVCDDPAHHEGPPATMVGAIPEDHQPTFAHPPNDAQREALEAEDARRRVERLTDRVNKLTRG